jgi:hypothetical protein
VRAAQEQPTRGMRFAQAHSQEQIAPRKRPIRVGLSGPEQEYRLTLSLL